MSYFPPGMASVTVTMDALDYGLGAVAGQWSVEAETPAIWTATGQLLLTTPIPKASTYGKASVTLAASKQPGFGGVDAEGPFSIPEFAYCFSYTAKRGGAVYRRFVVVPPAAGSVRLVDLPDLGGWRTVVTRFRDQGA